jgi:hypothetical protein
MNARMLPKFVALLGKLAKRYGVDPNSSEFNEVEKDLLRMAVIEYDFYHAHEAPITAEVPVKVVEVATTKRTAGRPSKAAS